MTRSKMPRGAALIETVFVVGFGLIILFETLQLGIVGFYQMSADGASFVDAHGQSARTSEDTQSYGPWTSENTHQLFPEIATTDVTSVATAAPNANVEVDYGFNNRNTYTQRHGGDSYMLPDAITSTVSKPGLLSIFGKSINVTGDAIEPLWKEHNCHFHGGAATCDYFTEGENTGPYLVGFSVANRCDDVPPWSACGGNPKMRAFGLAEHLDQSNWSYGTPGIVDATGSILAVGRMWAVDPNQKATFRGVLYHQLNFSQIAKFFENFPTLQQLDTAYPIVPGLPGSASIFRFDAKTVGAIKTVYSWDAQLDETNPTTKFGLSSNVLNPEAGI